jgi:hypothetical protein
VPGDGRDQAAVVPRRGVLPLLSGQLEVLLGAVQVGVGPPGLSQREQEQAAVTAGPGLPEEVPVPVQDRHHLVEVAQRVIPAAHVDQDGAPAHQDPPGQGPARGPGGGVQMGQAAGGMAGPRHRDPEAGLDVGLALRLAAGPGRPQGAPQFGQGLVEVAEIAQGDAGRLVRHGGLGGRHGRTAGQQRPRPA